MAQELAALAAKVRLLRGIDDADAQEATRQSLTWLGDLEEEREALVENRETSSSSDVGAPPAAKRNLARIQAVGAWLDERAAVDHDLPGRPPLAQLSSPPAGPASR